MPKHLEISEVVLLLLATLLVFALVGITVIRFEEHRQAEMESRMMGCRYLGKLQGPSNLYAFECGQLVQLKRL